MSNGWTPDILGTPFEQLTLPLGRDSAGDIVATLVRRLPSFRERPGGSLVDVDVLYVHGWSDFFFQRDLAAFWNRLGARFYAVDLRKYGRSLREGQTPGYITSLDEYDPDIAAALEVIGHEPGSDSARRLVLMGHSTGGLVLTLWAARHPEAASALVLNSPWLELQLGSMARQVIAPLVDVRALVDPQGGYPTVDLGFYTRAQEKIGTLPELDEHSTWRPAHGFTAHPAWFSAILEGHRRVASGIEVGCPVLVLLSARSTPPFTWTDAMTASDSVLLVDDIAREAPRIGSRVTIERIDGAIHDVFLSTEDVRNEAFARLSSWLTAGVLG